MKNYELMVIFTPVLSQEEYKVNAKKITSIIEENSGKMIHEDFWGLKSLAYPIEKKTTALYYVLEYQAETNLNAKLTVLFNRDESIMRFMITHLDKNAMAYTAKKRGGASNASIVNQTQEA